MSTLLQLLQVVRGNSYSNTDQRGELRSDPLSAFSTVQPRLRLRRDQRYGKAGHICSVSHILSSASQETFIDDKIARYEWLLIKRLYQSETEFRECLSPLCNYAAIYTNIISDYRCHACRYRMCFRCDVPWHEGQTCAMYQRLRKDQGTKENDTEASEREITRISKQCPNPKCRIRIEKGDGCFHMTCKHSPKSYLILRWR